MLVSDFRLEIAPLGCPQTPLVTWGVSVVLQVGIDRFEHRGPKESLIPIYVAYAYDGDGGMLRLAAAALAQGR